MEQFVPQVSDTDVERVLKRDVAVDAQHEIGEIIRRLEVREKARVVLACLKNSGGDMEKLKCNLAEAPGYYREHIGDAEYPNYVKKIFRIDKLSEAEIASIIEKDKTQYLTWLNAEKSAHEK
jgi:hypothetical protein